MAECIHFISSFHSRPMVRDATPENCSGWTVMEEWSVDVSSMIQKITLKKHDYFESYYYADLEIVSVPPQNDMKISKSKRRKSDDIEILVHGDEYKCFGINSGIVSDKVSKNLPEIYAFQCKVTLTPIFRLIQEELFKKPGKRTKIDLLKGLKTLSNNISSMKDDVYSDIIVHCDKKQVKAHKNILSTRSTLFNKLLQGGKNDEEVQSCLEVEVESDHDDDDATATNASNIMKVRVKNIHHSIFHEFIDFIYSGRYETFDIERAKNLLVAARTYGIYDLENKCILFLKSQITVNTCEDIYSFASECNFEKLQIHVLDYAKRQIVPKKRYNLIEVNGDEEDNEGANEDIEDEDDEDKMTDWEKMKWLKIMRKHPFYLNDVLKLKRNKKLRDVILMNIPNDASDESEDYLTARRFCLPR